MFTFIPVLFATVLSTSAVASAPNPDLTQYVGTWECTPRMTTGRNAFTLDINLADDSTLHLQSRDLFPEMGWQRWHTLTLSDDGEWTLDQGLVPYPFSGRPTGDGAIDFTRTALNYNRLFWQLNPDQNVLQFSLYKSTELPMARINHMVTCDRT